MPDDNVDLALINRKLDLILAEAAEMRKELARMRIAIGQPTNRGDAMPDEERVIAMVLEMSGKTRAEFEAGVAELGRMRAEGRLAEFERRLLAHARQIGTGADWRAGDTDAGTDSPTN